ncbi:MAG: tetratricopeptide repeat protein, partial [Candidatus Rokubacteria bacterium]|nr:tetratricopeptide repeat protein [Candidatus Rokubacteria bacterium]
QAPTREQALDALARSEVEARRQGAAWLGEKGTMADAAALVRALRDPDEVVRALAEHSLWEVWSRSGDPEVDNLFQIGIEQMNQRDAAAAIATFGEIIRKKPEFAEGWNKRATLYYIVGEYEKSLADCDEVVKRNPVHFGALSGFGMIYLQQGKPEKALQNPVHFGALSGFGMIYLQLGKPEKALEYFQRALQVNPNLGQVEATVEQLKRLLIDRRKDTI